MSSKPLVALVGRPNVGKSTLFNRLVGRRMAVVSDVAGTTRDRLYAETDWNGQVFILVDTGGIEFKSGWKTAPLSEDSEQFMPAIRQQASIAIQDADIILHVVDGSVGVTAADREVADALRRTKKPVIIVANKLESSKLKDTVYEFYELAMGEVMAISALHGSGVGDLLDRIVESVPEIPEDDIEDDSIKVALLGRPNAGKSTLVNKLLGEERVIVSPIPGTTRDAIDSLLVWEDQEFTLIDTAGIRRRGRIVPGVEKYSVLRAVKALDRADIALLLIDAVEGITAQDAHIAGMLQDEDAGIIILVNKWDGVKKDSYTMNTFEERIREDLNFIPYAPLMFISAQSGQRVNKILELVQTVNNNRYLRIPTANLNKFLRDITYQTPPPNRGGVKVKFYFATQVGVAPPTFVFFCNKPQWVHFSYQRFLENRLREQYSFAGTPIKIVLRARSEDRFGKPT